MGNCKPQTAKYHVTTASRSRLQFAAVSDLRQGFLGVWKSRKPESGIGTGMGTGTGTGNGKGTVTAM